MKNKQYFRAVLPKAKKGSKQPIKSPSPDKKRSNIITPTKSPSLQYIHPQMVNSTPTKFRKISQTAYQTLATDDYPASRYRYSPNDVIKLSPSINNSFSLEEMMRNRQQYHADDYMRMLQEKEETIKELKKIIAMINENNQMESSNIGSQFKGDGWFEKQIFMNNNAHQQIKELTIENQKLYNRIQYVENEIYFRDQLINTKEKQKQEQRKKIQQDTYEMQQMRHKLKENEGELAKLRGQVYNTIRLEPSQKIYTKQISNRQLENQYYALQQKHANEKEKWEQMMEEIQSRCRQYERREKENERVIKIFRQREQYDKKNYTTNNKDKRMSIMNSHYTKALQDELYVQIKQIQKNNDDRMQMLNKKINELEKKLETLEYVRVAMHKRPFHDDIHELHTIQQKSHEDSEEKIKEIESILLEKTNYYEREMLTQKEEIKELKRKIEEYQNQIGYGDQHKKCKQQINKFKLLLIQANNFKEDLERKFEQLNHNYEELAHNHEELSRKYNQIRDGQKKMYNQEENRCVELQRKCEQFKDKLQNFKAHDYCNLQLKYEELEDQNKNIKYANNEILRKVEGLELEQVDIKKKIKTQQLVIESYKEKLAEAEKNNRKLQRKMNQIESDSEEKDKITQDKIQQLVNNYQKEIEILKNKVHEHNLRGEEYVQLQQQYQLLQEQYEKLQSSYGSQIQKNNLLRKQYNEMHESCIMEQKKLQKLQMEYNKLQQSQGEKRDNNRKLEQKYRGLEKKYSELEEKSEESEGEWNGRYENQKSQYQLLKQKYKTIKNQKDKLQQQNGRHLQQNKQLRQNKNGLTIQLQQLREQINSIRNINEELSRYKLEYEQKEIQRKNLEKEMQEMKKKSMEIQNNYIEEINNYKQELAYLRERIEEIKKQQENQENNHKKEIQLLRNALNEEKKVNKTLKDYQKIIYGLNNSDLTKELQELKRMMQEEHNNNQTRESLMRQEINKLLLEMEKNMMAYTKLERLNSQMREENHSLREANLMWKQKIHFLQNSIMVYEKELKERREFQQGLIEENRFRQREIMLKKRQNLSEPCPMSGYCALQEKLNKVIQRQAQRQGSISVLIQQLAQE